MRCEDVQPLLSDHLDGALAPAEAAGVAAHLGGCDACRAELDDLRAVVAMLQAVPREGMPGGLFDRISAALAAEPLPEGAAMGCDEAQDLFSDRLNGSLDAEEATPLEAHLAECASCRQAAAEVAAVVGLLRRVEREALPIGLAERIAAALAAEGEAHAVTVSPPANVVVSPPTNVVVSPPVNVVVSPPANRIGCDEAEDYMSGYLAGDLDGWEDDAIGAHLKECPPCQRKLAELKAVVGLLRDVPQELVPADLADRVGRALAALPELTTPVLVAAASATTPAPKKRGLPHWLSGMAGAVAACAAILVWQHLPGAGLPRIETAAVSVKQDVAVNIGFDVDESVDGVIFQVDLPDGLKFIDDKAQPMLAQSVSWKGSLEKGKTVVPIVVRGIRPGRYEIEAFVRKGGMMRKTTIVLPVQG